MCIPKSLHIVYTGKSNTLTSQGVIEAFRKHHKLVKQNPNNIIYLNDQTVASYTFPAAKQLIDLSGRKITAVGAPATQLAVKNACLNIRKNQVGKIVTTHNNLNASIVSEGLFIQFNYFADQFNYLELPLNSPFLRTKKKGNVTIVGLKNGEIPSEKTHKAYLYTLQALPVGTFKDYFGNKNYTYDEKAKGKLVLQSNTCAMKCRKTGGLLAENITQYNSLIRFKKSFPKGTTHLVVAYPYLCQRQAVLEDISAINPNSFTNHNKVMAKIKEFPLTEQNLERMSFIPADTPFAMQAQIIAMKKDDKGKSVNLSKPVSYTVLSFKGNERISLKNLTFLNGNKLK